VLDGSKAGNVDVEKSSSKDAPALAHHEDRE